MAGLSNIGGLAPVRDGRFPAERRDQAGSLQGESAVDGVRQATPGAENELSSEEKAQVEKLRQRDREVRQHEQAHMAAGGQYVRGGANFAYQTGPDGRRYATGGEVSIDVAPESKPEATIRKMQVVKRAALAPAEPSPQDRAVHAAASKTEMRARQDLARQRQEKDATGPGLREEGVRSIEDLDNDREARQRSLRPSPQAAAAAYGAMSNLQPTGVAAQTA